MYRKNGTYRKEVKNAMRGGEGDVLIEHFWDEENELLSANRLFARLTLAPGSSIGFHRHENEEEIFVIVKGEAELDDDGKCLTRLGAGDTIHTGNGAGHSVKNCGGEPLELLAVINKY